MAIICRTHKLLFIMTPRTGCTAIGDLLLDRFGGEWLPPDDLLSDAGKYLLQRKHNTLADLTAHGLFTPESRREFLVFVTVRNPFDSLVSQYVKKATVCHEYLKDPGLYVHRMPSYIADMQYCASHSFEEWIEHRFAARRWTRLWRLRRRSMFNKFVDGADIVMRFETIHADFSRVMRKANLPSDITIPEVNVTTARERDYRSYYSPRTRRIIERIFSEDLRRFNYRF